jgi:hypothetical protein
MYGNANSVKHLWIKKIQSNNLHEIIGKCRDEYISDYIICTLLIKSYH